jgi:hypothetical protein
VLLSKKDGGYNPGQPVVDVMEQNMVFLDRVNEGLVGIVGDDRQLQCCAAFVMTQLDNFG